MLKKIKSLVRPFYISGKRGLRNRWNRVRFAGSAVECPFCDRTFRSFMATGALDRPFWNTPEGARVRQLEYVNVANNLCPSCRSGERHRLLYFYLRDNRGIFQHDGLRLLDVAPDDFLWNRVFSRAPLEYVSLDVHPSRSPSVVGDLQLLGVGSDVFDAILCYHVLEHVPDDRAAMRELLRVLRPGGWAIIQVPIWADETVEDPDVERSDYAAVYGHPDHVRRYGLDYEDRLREAGFNVTVDPYARNLPGEFRRRYGIFATEDIYLCQKPS